MMDRKAIDAGDAADSKLLADVKRAIFATMRTDPPLPDDAKHWIKTHDTETGRITWTRRNLSEEWQRLQAKMRGIDQPSEAGDPC